MPSIIPPINPQLNTINRFGVPSAYDTAVSGGLLMPKLKHRFRVYALNFGVPTGTAAIDFTRQVVTAGRPTINFNNTPLHSYNNITYMAQKPEWNNLEITLRDDIYNNLTSLVSAQVQRQMNHYTQSAAVTFDNYKFQMLLQVLDGTMGTTGTQVDSNVLEDWYLEGCYLETVAYDSMDYSSNDPVMITLTVRYDNATQGDESALASITG